MAILERSPASAGLPSSRALAAVRPTARVVARLLLVAVMLLPVYGALTYHDARMASRLAVAGLFCITLVRPENGLLLCAGLLPLAAPMGAVIGFPALREPLVLAFLAGLWLRDTFRPPTRTGRASIALLTPAFLLAAVVAASACSQLMAQQVFEAFPLPFLHRVLSELSGRYAVGNDYFGLSPAFTVLEGIGLFAAALHLCARNRRLASRTLAMAAVAAAGVAALNLYRVAEIGFRSPWRSPAFLFDARNIRISFSFRDFNAAGSYLAMMLLVTVGAGLAVRARRWAWSAAAILIAASLWFTGSRTAWACAALCAMIAVPRVRAAARSAIRAARTGPRLAAIAIVLLMLIAGVVARLHDNPSVAIASRAGLAATAVRMSAAHPLFGVGVGRFIVESAAYIDPAFARTYYPRENAHNNFLQVLAELGVVGFAPFIWLLVVAGRRITAAVRDGRDRLLMGAGYGILAFLLTCLAGHPLLVPEVALAFWLLFGAATAAALPTDEATDREIAHRGNRREWALAVVLGCLIVSVPIRAWSYIDHEADLSSAALGFSPWTKDAGGVRYRTIEGRAQFFVPATTCQLSIWLRVADAQKQRNVDVELLVDGTAINRFPAAAGEWRQLRTQLRTDSRKRFRRIELRSLPDATVNVWTRAPTGLDCGG